MAGNRMPAPERKKQILKCAVRVFARSNYQSARVADIAADIGISEAAIYRHFPTKKSIYLELLEHMSTRIITFWQKEVDREDNAYLALRNMGLTYYRRMINHPHELRVHFQAIAEVGDPDIARRLHLDHENYMDFFQKALAKGIRQGVFRKDADVGALTWLFNGVGIMMNMMNLLSFRKELDEDVVTRIIDHLLESIKA